MSIVSSRFKAVALLFASLSGMPVAVAQSAQDQVIVRPAPRIGPPWLGVSLATTSGEPGVEITAILRRSPADGTGVKVGDRILEVAGKPVSSLAGVRTAVRAHKSGDSIELTGRRNGKPLTLTFKLAPMPSGEEIVRNHLVGYPAPEFMFRYVGDGKDAHLSELRGKPTIIEFWATWCGPCHKVQRELAAVKQKFGDKLHIVGVSDEEPKIVREHLERYPSRYAMALDTQGAARTGYIIESIPLVVILDAEHNVAAVVSGANKGALIEKKIRNLVER